VAGTITLAVLCFARALDSPPALPLRWLLAGWAACAAAVLAKGLIGIVLPALVIGPWLLAQGRWREMLRLLHPLGLLLFAALALPWFAAMQMRHPGFFDYFVMEQHFRRFAQSNFNNVHPAWFYFAVLPALTLPWSGWAFAALAQAWRERAGALRSPLLLYAWWTLAIVGFFSLPSSKLVGYVLPALAPWCALIALAAARGRAWRWVAPLAAIACVTIVGVLAWKAPHSSRATALALAAERAPGERVVMVDEMFYDLPFYARLAEPAIVASDWADPGLPKRDNWRKELYDAARFDPELARSVLWPIGRLDALSCGVPAVWFVAAPGQAERLRALTGIERKRADPNAELWRAPGRACG
jgi:hypothetical protein